MGLKMANEKRLDLINKWDVVNKLIQLENNYQFYKEQWDADVLYRRIVELEIGIGKAPTVDAVEVVHGHWEDGWGEDYYGRIAYKSIDCSECHEIFKIESRDREYWKNRFKVCPFCGAKMDLEVKL